jgi:hypothetical protein
MLPAFTLFAMHIHDSKNATNAPKDIFLQGIHQQPVACIEKTE